MTQHPAPFNGQSEYERLLDLPAMTTWTADRQREHGQDAADYEAALAVVQAGLRSQVVAGDGRWSAALRARRVEKHLRRMAQAARTQEQAAEELRKAYAGHVAYLKALPAQRADKARAKELRKAGRRAAVGSLAAKSLHKSAESAVAPAAVEQPAPGAQVRGIGDLWQQKGA
ncbi:hypothetical protein ACFV6G_41910 [Streptomyces lavendulae]|uniref:hypothetical protein n=1 Tax=Streptomyces lavendulae TaxID=1914 RepID=UPI0031EBCE5F